MSNAKPAPLGVVVRGVDEGSSLSAVVDHRKAPAGFSQDGQARICIASAGAPAALNELDWGAFRDRIDAMFKELSA